jgi:hypothetical protein
MREQQARKIWRAAAVGCWSCALVVVISAAAAAVAGPGTTPGGTSEAPRSPDAPGLGEAAAPPKERVAVDLDPAVLDRLIGDYLLPPNNVLSITRDGNRLFAQLIGQKKDEIFAQTENEFFYKMIDAGISFQHDAHGRTIGLVLHLNGTDSPASRIDPTTARQISLANTEKIQGQTATPGSEAALRRLIDGFRTGKPPYEEMTPKLADLTRRNLPQMQAAMTQLGAVRSIEFHGVSEQGWDIYYVKHENGKTQWRIVLGADGLIAGALVSAAP